MKKLHFDYLVDTTLEGLEKEDLSKVIDLTKKFFLRKGVNPYSFYDVYKHIRNNLVDFGYQESSRENPDTFAHTLANIYQFLLYGRKVLAPTEELCIAIMNTKYRKISIRLAHRDDFCAYIKLPDKGFYFPGIKEQGWLEGVFVKMESEEDRYLWNIWFVAGSPEENDVLFYTDSVHLEIPPDKKDAPLEACYNYIAKNAEAFTQKDENARVEMGQILDFTLSFLTMYNGTVDIVEEVVDDEYKRLIEEMSRKKNDSKVRKIENRIRKTSPSQVSILRPPVSYKNVIRINRTNPSRQTAIGSPAARKEMRKHIVMGHYRNQPYGPKDNPHYETIWIYPYWRGKRTDSGLLSSYQIVK